MRSPAYALIVGMVVVLPTTARADTMTQTSTLALVSGSINSSTDNYADQPGTSFSKFNSALGTLTSITFDL